ncbi:2-phosphosulfolactate phosphatase, partial [Phycicoccus jejuensis]|uniref:2-phosphosulfolactate phosphatase n=1 Tax=Phycicoccus jejuensis TaxID=367299 RepID=UPI00068BB89B
TNRTRGGEVALESLMCSVSEIGALSGAAVPQVAVVIDVLRAFTVAPWVFARGAATLRFARDDIQALQMKSMLGPSARTIKDGPPAAGFDLVNSPGFVRGSDLTGCHIIQRTTNGTKGVLAARRCRWILCASLVNARATARHVLATGASRVAFVITGEDGTADEDLACADLIRNVMSGPTADAVQVRQRVVSSPAARALDRGYRAGMRGVHPQDVGMCADVDRFDFALVATVLDDHAVVEVSRSTVPFSHPG